MSITQIAYSSNFVKQFKKLSPLLQKQAIKTEKLFKKDPFSPRLKTHKLSGRLKDVWAFSINYKDRIIFEFLGKGRVIFYKIGSIVASIDKESNPVPVTA